LVFNASDIDGMSDSEWDAMLNDDTLPGILILLD
jgi:hypothetical protein